VRGSFQRRPGLVAVCFAGSSTNQENENDASKQWTLAPAALEPTARDESNKDVAYSIDIPSEDLVYPYIRSSTIRVKSLSILSGSDSLVSAVTVVGGGEGRGASGTPTDTAAVKVALAMKLLFEAAIGTFTGDGAGVVGLATDSYAAAVAIAVTLDIFSSLAIFA